MRSLISLVITSVNSFSVLCLIFSSHLAWSQYTTFDNAQVVNGNTFRLTNDVPAQSGSVWYGISQNLNAPFEVSGEMFFGTRDDGADGIAFVMQQECVQGGTIGGGMGYNGLAGRSLAVEFDTWENNAFQGDQDNNDPPYDHVGIQTGGNVSHQAGGDLVLSGPAPLRANQSNIEDGNWHSFRINWNPGDNRLRVYFEGVEIASITRNIVGDIFNGNPSIYFGFTSSTGGFSGENMVRVNPLPAPNIADQNICLGESAIVELQGNVVWSNNQYVTPLGGGRYELTPPVNTQFEASVIDRCNAQTEYDFWVNVSDLEVDLPGNNICNGNSVRLTPNVTGANGGLTYAWNNGIGGNIASPVVSPENSTTYRVTVTDGTGCQASDDATVIVQQTPNANAGTDDSFCEGTGGVSLNASGGGNYSWSNSGSLNNGNIANPIADPTNSTTYTLTVTDANGCTDQDDVRITVLASPNANAGPDRSFCEGSGGVTITASGVGNYSWSPSDGLSNPASTSPLANPAANTVYTLTITSNEGCEESDNVLVSIENVPNANAGPDDSFCEGEGGITLNATGGGNYSWSNSATLNNGNIASPIANPSNSTTYTLTVTSTNGCTDQDNVVITVLPTPSANAGADIEFCIGTGGGVLEGSGGDSYSWTPVEGLSDANVAAPLVDVVSTTIYTLEVTGANGCADSDEVEVIVNQLPIANAGPDQRFCQGLGGLTLLASGGEQYSWTPTEGLTESNVSNPIASPAINTTYIVRVEDGNGCVNTDQVEVTLDARPDKSNAGQDQTVCSLISVLEGNTPIIGIGEWSVLSGNSVLENTQQNNSSVSDLNIGENEYVWTISNGVCPNETDTVIITSTGTLNVPNAGPDQIICSTSSTLAGNAVQIGETGTWSLLSGTSTIENSTSNTSEVTALSVGINEYIWTISNGVCPNLSDTVIIQRDNVPSISDAGQDQTVCSLSAVLTGNTPAIGTGAWSILTGGSVLEDLQQSNSPVTDLDIGVNEYIWTISNGVCPSETDTLMITSTGALTVPNAGPDQVICDTSSFLIGNSVQVGETGTWSLISGTSTIENSTNNTSEVVALSVGINGYIWTISNGVCPNLSDTVSIQRDSIPSFANAGQDQTVCSLATVLEGNNPAIGTGVWSVLTGTSVISDSLQSNASVFDLNVGVNEYIWTVSNGVCSIHSDTIQILRDDFPSNSLVGEDDTLCNNTAYALVGNTPEVGIGQWSVIAGDASITDVSLPITEVTNLSIVNNEFVWSISNGVCPIESDTIKILSSVSPVADAGEDITICLNTTTILNGIGSISTTTGALLYDWSGAHDLVSNSNSSVIASPLDTTTYTLTVTNAEGCYSVDEVIVNVHPLQIPQISLAASDTVICDNDHVDFTTTIVNGGDSPSYIWMINGIPTNGNTSFFSSNTLSHNDVISVQLISNAMCPVPSSDIDQVVMDVTTVDPQIEIGLQSDLVCDEDALDTDILFTEGEGELPEYSWFINGNEVIGSDKGMRTVGMKDGDAIWALLTSSEQCSPGPVKSNIVYAGVENCMCDLDITNVMTPNGDQANDTWLINGLDCWDSRIITVFNRWGDIVWKDIGTGNSEYISWDGKRNGQDVPVAVYYYVILVADDSGVEKDYSGSVTILR